MMDEKKIFITGASGRLGRAVLKKLPEAIPLVRRPYGLPNEKTTDFSIPELKTFFQKAKVIIHLAGSLAFTRKKLLWDINVGLTKKIVEAAPPDCKIIFASSISVYGKKLLELPADEHTPCKPDSEYAKSKFSAEQIVKTHPNNVILRIGTMCGPQFGDYLAVLKKIRERKMMVIGDGKNRIPFVHVDDVAKVIFNAIEQGQGTYVVAGDPLSQEEIYGIAAEELHTDPPKKRVSFALAYWFAWLRTKLGKTGFTPEHIAILGSDRAFDCSKAKRELGFRPRPIKEGIKEIADILKGL